MRRSTFIATCVLAFSLNFGPMSFGSFSLGGVPSAQASFIRAQDLYQSCEEFSEFCFGYMAGAYDGLFRTFLNKPNGFCLAPDVSLSMLRETFLTYVRTQPAVLNDSASDALVKSLLSGFPCQGS